MTTKRPRSPKSFTSLDTFLEEEGTREVFQAIAMKEVSVWQIAQAMKQALPSQ